MSEPLKTVEQVLNEFFAVEQNNRLTPNNFGFLMMRLRPLFHPEIQETPKQEGAFNGLAKHLQSKD